jgi:hypothetical protein
LSVATFMPLGWLGLSTVQDWSGLASENLGQVPEKRFVKSVKTCKSSFTVTGLSPLEIRLYFSLRSVATAGIFGLRSVVIA